MKLTSRVIPTWERLYDLLAADGVFTPGTAGDMPLVIFGDVDGTTYTLPDEAVLVVGVPPGQPDQRSATYGAEQSKDESFTLQVIVRSAIPGRNRAEALCRIKELSDAVQNVVRSITTGVPIGFSDPDPGPQCLYWRVARFAPQLHTTGEGSTAYAEIDIYYYARI